MSIEKFITDMLNIDPSTVESINSVESSDESVSIHIKLKQTDNMRCPYCGNSLVSNGFYKKKLTHSTLVNRSCTIIFHRRRYICRNCECTFSEPDPFASKGETITHETKINVLKDLKKAYDLKESYIAFNATCSKKDAPEKLAEQIAAFADSEIPEYIEFYNLLINWNTEIINSFSIIGLRRISNSYIESRNRQIEKLFLNANEFTNFKRTRNRILYCLNKKDSYKF